MFDLGSLGLGSMNLLPSFTERRLSVDNQVVISLIIIQALYPLLPGVLTGAILVDT